MTIIEQQKQQSEIAVFWDEFAKHLPKSVEREALGDEKICNAFRAVYPMIVAHTRIDWLRSEIEKLEGMKKDIANWNSHEQLVNMTVYNEAVNDIITRYKEELKVLEGK